ncbi:hypothetical protein GQ54DRAFT_309013 [Martensiomyces pterosporus]|nr:hypothetical protein GQ54DRAFT_309013 [Martensiomyces pterosporus]
MATIPTQRVSVIGGGGNVGAATAYALITKGVAAEVLIVDVVDKAALGQALDISDAAFLMPALLNNTSQVFPITHYVEKYGCYMSWPAAIGTDGVEQSFDVAVNDTEAKKLEVAVNAIKEACAKYE